MYNLEVFSKFTRWYNHHHYLIPEHFHHRPPNSPYPLAVTSSPSLAITNLHSVDLPILCISYK